MYLPAHVDGSPSPGRHLPVPGLAALSQTGKGLYLNEGFDLTLTVDKYFYNNTTFGKGTRKATRIRSGLKN